MAKSEKPKMVKVRAKELGFDSVSSRRIRSGEEFEVPEGIEAAWYEPAVEGEPAPKKPGPKKQEPVALSQLARGKKRVEGTPETFSQLNADQQGASGEGLGPEADLAS